jgi:hypothetical protein
MSALARLVHPIQKNSMDAVFFLRTDTFIDTSSSYKEYDGMGWTVAWVRTR